MDTTTKQPPFSYELHIFTSSDSSKRAGIFLTAEQAIKAGELAIEDGRAIDYVFY